MTNADPTTPARACFPHRRTERRDNPDRPGTYLTVCLDCGATIGWGRVNPSHVWWGLA
jgi:hypothetical protein